MFYVSSVHRFAQNALCRGSPIVRNLATARRNATKRVAVIGLGRMGRIRSKLIRETPGLKLTAVVDVNPSLSFEEDIEYEPLDTTSTFYNSLDKLLQVDANTPGGVVDAIWCCASSNLHEEVICQAAEAKKHCAVEKPVAPTVEAIGQCYDTCESHGVHLLCSFQRRFDPAYQQLREHTITHLGELASIHSIFRDHPMPSMDFLRLGGDPFHDLMVHDMDYIRWLTGDEPKSLYAMGTSFNAELRAANVYDFATVTLQMAHGTGVTMELSRHSAYGYDQRIEVFGANGSRAAVTNPRESDWEWSGDIGSRTGSLQHSFPQRFRDAFRAEVLHFRDVLAGKVHAGVTKRDAMAATIIAEAARLSASTGKVVEFNSPDPTKPLQYSFRE